MCRVSGACGAERGGWLAAAGRCWRDDTLVGALTPLALDAVLRAAVAASERGPPGVVLAAGWQGAGLAGRAGLRAPPPTPQRPSRCGHPPAAPSRCALLAAGRSTRSIEESIEPACVQRCRHWQWPRTSFPSFLHDSSAPVGPYWPAALAGFLFPRDDPVFPQARRFASPPPPPPPIVFRAGCSRDDGGLDVGARVYLSALTPNTPPPFN